jgi:uncharacterized protein YbjT (DUF2867 family)
MSAIKENLLVLGATGYIGNYIIDKILDAKDSFERIAVFTSQNTLDTKPELVNSLKERGADIIIGDSFNETDILKAFQGLRDIRIRNARSQS